MYGCNDDGDFCKIGGSAGDPVLDGCGYDNGAGQGLLYATPIDSKFEFIFADEKNLDPKWPNDSFNTSAVDGLTASFVYSYYDHSKKAVYEVFCGMPENDCPTQENIYTDCRFAEDCEKKSVYTLNLKYTNKDGKYMSCKSLRRVS